MEHRCIYVSYDNPLPSNASETLLTQATKHTTSSMVEDDASPGARGGCLGLEQPHRDCSKMQVFYQHTIVILWYQQVLHKAEKVRHGANFHLLQYIPLWKDRKKYQLAALYRHPFLPLYDYCPKYYIDQLRTLSKLINGIL